MEEYGNSFGGQVALGIKVSGGLIPQKSIFCSFSIIASTIFFPSIYLTTVDFTYYNTITMSMHPSRQAYVADETEVSCARIASKESDIHKMCQAQLKTDGDFLAG